MTEYNTTNNGDVTSSQEVIPDSVPEPIPDWDTARAQWRWAWYLHIYGLGLIYFLLAIYAGISMLHFRRRLRVQKYILGMNWILLILGLSRALLLFVDAYESTGKLPVPVTRVLYGIAFPCLTSSYSLIQLVFMRITKVNMGSSKLQNYRVLAAIITSHFTIVIVIDITVAYKNNLKWLLMLCQAFFITWGLILCFGFIYGGFRMTQFTAETQRVLKQLSAYQKVKHELAGMRGQKHDLALHRISRPKIRLIDDENQGLSGASNSSAEESSNSLSFYNEAPLICDDSALAQAYMAQCDRSRKTKHSSATRLTKRNKYRTLTTAVGGESDSLPYISSESDLILDSPPAIQTTLPQVHSHMPCIEPAPQSRDLCEMPSTSIEAALSKDHSQMGIKSNGISQIPGSLPKAYCEIASIDRQQINGEVCSEPRSDTNPHSSAFVNLTLDLKDDGNQCKDTVIMNGFINTQGSSELDKECNRRMDEIVQESGYMADTELNSPRRYKNGGGFCKQRKRKNMNCNVDIDDDCDPTNIDGNSSPKHEPYPLKITDGTVSLYRIRQGKTLHKALRITYFTTLLGFICCILQLYAMFGVYGVLSTDQKVEAWPWFIYHLFLR